jgi:hypothetical protein
MDADQHGRGTTGRDPHTAVWTGSRMIVWGGYDGSYCLNTGAAYDPTTDTWTPTSTTNAPRARERHTAVWAGSRMILSRNRPFRSVASHSGRGRKRPSGAKPPSVVGRCRWG